MKRMKRAMVWLLCAALLTSTWMLEGCNIEDTETTQETKLHPNMGGIGNILGSDESTEAETPEESASEEESTGDDEPADVTPEETTEETPEETPEETTEAPTEAPAGPQITFDVNLDALRGLSNEIKSWGPGTNVDGENRPTGSTMYQNKYGQYDADFIKESSKKIYLTLDEGYENGYSAVILDALKEKKVSAVFFVTMSYAKSEPELIRRMIDEGHVVGAHSVSHPADGMPSLSLEAQLAELRDLHEYVKNEFGYEMYLFRYPAGIFSEQSLALVQATGYRSVFWSYAYRDWVTDDQPDPTEALNKAMSRLHPGAIYLLHAVSSTNAQIMRDFIDQARAAGYEFVKYEAE